MARLTTLATLAPLEAETVRRSVGGAQFTVRSRCGPANSRAPAVGVPPVMVRIVGLVTACSIAALVLEVERELQPHARAPRLFDLRGCMMALDAVTMYAAVAASAAYFPALWEPMAMLVTPAQQPLVQQFACLMSRAGACRAAFAEEPAGMAWAVEQAAVHRQWGP